MQYGIHFVQREDILAEGPEGVWIRTLSNPTPARPYYTSTETLYFSDRQDGVCLGCDTRPCWWQRTGDHLVARSRGGAHELSNGGMMCNGCNSRKGVRSLEWLRDRNVVLGILPGNPSPQLNLSWR